MLECQGCGRELRPLNSAEQRDIIENPYNWIVWCPELPHDTTDLGAS